MGRELKKGARVWCFLGDPPSGPSAACRGVVKYYQSVEGPEYGIDLDMGGFDVVPAEHVFPGNLTGWRRATTLLLDHHRRMASVMREQARAHERRVDEIQQALDEEAAADRRLGV